MEVIGLPIGNRPTGLFDSIAIYLNLESLTTKPGAAACYTLWRASWLASFLATSPGEPVFLASSS